MGAGSKEPTLNDMTDPQVNHRWHRLTSILNSWFCVTTLLHALLSWLLLLFLLLLRFCLALLCSGLRACLLALWYFLSCNLLHRARLGGGVGRRLLLLLWRIRLALDAWGVLKVDGYDSKRRAMCSSGFTNRGTVLDVVKVARDRGMDVVLCWLELGL
jgi:hypothetical protein